MATITASIPNPNGRNILPDPYLLTSTLSLNGSTSTDTHPAVGGPDGGAFFRREIVAPNTTSPMSMALCPAGTAGIPVVPGEQLVSSIYARKTAGGPSARLDVSWYNAAGSGISTGSSSGAAGATWARLVATTWVAPALAAFMQLRAVWTGTALTNQLLDLAMAQLERGNVVTDFTDNRPVIRPLLVLGYEYQNASRNLILELEGSKYPTVFLRPAASQSGTLSLLFGSDSDAREAREILTAPDRFSFEESAAGEAFEFIVSGPVSVTKVPGVNYWTVDAEYREVEALVL